MIRSGELWAVTTCFSPVQDGLRTANYRRFRAALDVPLATIEIAFDGHSELGAEDADLYMRVHDADVLWHKERLLNLLLRRLPRECRYVAWMDADVLMTDAEWPVRTVEMLRAVPLVQLFSSLRYLGPDGSQDGALRESIAATIKAGAPPAAVLGDVVNRTGNAASPGMAWAARRDLLERHGFYDSCIMGGGDTALACAAFGVPAVAMQLHHMNGPQRERYSVWAERFHQDVGGCVGVVAGELQHLWHGSLASRRAGERHVDLAAHGFDPLVDIAPGLDGAWRWASHKPGLHALLKTYFAGRVRSA